MLLFFLLLFTMTEAHSHCDQELQLTPGELKRVPSPNYPDVDGPGTRCRWTVTAPEDLGIVFSCPFPGRWRLSTHLLHPQYRGSCQGKFHIEPEDENSTDTCVSHPFTRIVDTNRMVIQYMVLEGKIDNAFVCYLRAQPKRIITNETIVHADLGGPVELPCNFIIPGEAVSVLDWVDEKKARFIYSLFAGFETLANGRHKPYPERTNRTSLRVADGVAYLILDPVQESDAGRYTCLLNFKSYAPSQRSVVVLKIGELESPTKYAGCDYHIHLDWGKPQQLKTSDPENGHPANKNCRWKFDSPIGTRIQLSCENAFNQAKDNCRFLSLYKTGEQNPDLRSGLQCGDSFNTETSIDSQMLITFTGNKQDVPPFVCNVTAVCEETIKLDHEYHTNGVRVESPDYPIFVVKEEFCRWTVESPPDTKILIKCPRIVNYLENDCQGWFHVYPDGEPNSEKLSVCGEAPLIQYSNSNKVILEFGGFNHVLLDNVYPFYCEFLAKLIKPTIENVVSVVTAEKGTAELPCDLNHDYDNLTAITWTQAGNVKPVYTLYTRGRSIARAINEKNTGSRVFMRVSDDGISYLVLQDTRGYDAGNYTCRVDFETAPPRSTVVILQVDVPPSIYGECDHIIRLNFSKPGELKSFNHPEQHPTEQGCRWTVFSQAGTYIQLSCPRLINQETQIDHCVFFSIYKTGSMNSTLSPFNCRDARNLERSDENAMIITFDNTEKISFDAFACTLTPVCDQIVHLAERGKATVLESPDYPLQTPPGVSCRWTVDSPYHTRILVSCPNTNFPKESFCLGWFTLSFYIGGHSTMQYCRYKKFSKLSVSNTTILEYKNRDTQPSGPFACYLTVEHSIWDVTGYREKECNCGRSNSGRRYFGNETKPNEYPMVAGLIPTDGFSTFCAATIVSARHALTAASCLINRTKESVELIVGVHDIAELDGPNQIRRYQITKMLMHSQWNGHGGFDIAILYVDNIAFKSTVLPACLPFANRNNTFYGQGVIALGFSYKVEQADLSITDDVTCSGWYPSYFSPVYKNTMCVFSTGTRLCAGGAGGPLLWLDPVTTQYKLVGIIPSGRCRENEVSNLIARVTASLDWIEQNTRDVTWCKR